MTGKEYLELRMAHQKFPDAMVHPASYFPCISFLLKQKNFRIHFVHRGSKLLRHSARKKIELWILALVTSQNYCQNPRMMPCFFFFALI